MKQKIFKVGEAFESNTCYVADRSVYDVKANDSFEEIDCWWTFLNSGNIPLRVAFVLRNLENVTIDLGGAKIVFHGRIMPFAVFNCKNIKFCNFSIDYDRPFFTQGTVLESGNQSVVIKIPPLYKYRIEGRDFIAEGYGWENRTVSGDMLFRCINPDNGRPSENSGVILGLIGDNISPRPNPPLPIHHLYAEDLGDRCIRLSGLPEHFVPRVGEILAMTHEDRRKTGFLFEECENTIIANVRLVHVGAMGITANLCHNITLNNFSMYVDEECPDRIISINADSFHCFHCTGLIKAENCRFENMLDDAINIHGNYLVAEKQTDERNILVKSKAAGLVKMKYLLPGDEIYIYNKNTQEIKAIAVVKEAQYLPGSTTDIRITLKDSIDIPVEKDDIIENRRMPEIEVRNCVSKAIGGFRISSGKKVVVDNCVFETPVHSILFSGDMNYWFENGPVKNVTIQNCIFNGCTVPIKTNCGFCPTEKEPYYHENIKVINNEINDFRGLVMRLKNVNNILFENNKITGIKENENPFELVNCSNVTIK